MEAIKDFFRSLLLLELIQGLALTGRYMFSRKITIQFPEEETPLSPRFRAAVLVAGVQCESRSGVRWPWG